MRKIAFWTQDDFFPRFPGFQGCEMILEIPDDIRDVKAWAIAQGHITQNYNFYQSLDVTDELARIAEITR